MNYNLKYARERSGLFQSDVAQKAGISTRMYQEYELGNSEPRASTAIRIANALGVINIRELWDVQNKSLGEPNLQH